jgi:hypothetical protein
MLRRVISSVVLASLVAAPAVSRTRIFCRHTGVEIADCAEQPAPPCAQLQTESCCDRQVTPAAGAMQTASREEIRPPVAAALPAVVADVAIAPAPVERVERPPSPRAKVFLITRALLI